ncbi:Alpha,alpha-trehalose-phosphate synthase [Sandaracinus amylolyticus]|nr:Alpha,alpha-trehalose-phosphate synthase [Sandaracinus amylolyticus]
MSGDVEPTSPESIRALATVPTLGVLVDLDGTLIPIASTPQQAQSDAEVASVLRDLALAPGTRVVVVSGRPRASLDDRVGGIEGIDLVAEHGAWRRDERGWSPLPLVGTPPDGIERTLSGLARAYPGAFAEPKTWSVCLHYRRVSASSREALVVEATHAIHGWMAQHPEYELLEADHALEVRHRGAQKGTAVPWLRERLGPGARLLALGDDLTDEDTFASLDEHDVAVLVSPSERTTRAAARLEGPTEVRALLRWLARARHRAVAHRDVTIGSSDSQPPPPLPKRRAAMSAENGTPLVVISNRMPDPTPGGDARTRNVGGLVAALEPALAARGGLWLGWSGRARAGHRDLAVDRSTVPARASFDFEPRWHELYYNGFANRSLWPLFHSLPERARYADEEWAAYVEVNEVFAEAASRVASRTGTIWAHDYHLLLVGAALRRRGFTGRLGHFLHIPFPPLDLLETMPWAPEIVSALLAFDLLGFHTRRFAANFLSCARELAGAERISEDALRVQGRIVRARAFPLGIDPAPFESPEDDEGVDEELAQLRAAMGERQLVLGVDRLDYTKGIPQRLEAFARMLELHPALRGQVSMIQVAVPSRSDVPEYAAQRAAIEALVGHINGTLGEAHWVPVRYVYRSYGRGHLARLYREADVALVTPLRDGMNLVAKEFVAAQDPKDPGVLLLSRFAGAAEEMRAAALCTNPYHRDGMANDLARALAMSLAERRTRHAELLAMVHRTTSASWADAFLSALEG